MDCDGYQAELRTILTCAAAACLNTLTGRLDTCVVNHHIIMRQHMEQHLFILNLKGVASTNCSTGGAAESELAEQECVEAKYHKAMPACAPFSAVPET